MNRLCMSAVALSLLSLPAAAADIRGPAHAIDGDTLTIDGTKVRLCGVDSVEHGELGYRAAGRTLEDLIAGRSVRCRPVGEGTPCDGRSKPNSYDRIVAQCFVGNADLAAEMVRAGRACAWPRYSGKAYADLGCIRQR